MDVCVWSPNLVECFFCKSFLIILLDPSPVVKSVFIVLWRIKIPKKVRFFAWQVLLGHVNRMDRILRKMPLIMSHFYFILRRKLELNLDGSVSMRDLLGTISRKSLIFCFFAKVMSVDDMWIPPPSAFQIERFFGLRGCAVYCGILGREQ